MMGLDLGSKTCGVALSDGLGLLAHPLKTLLFNNEDITLLIEPLASIIKEYRVRKIVLGLPKHMNNDLSKRATISLEFKQLLEDSFDCEVVLMDERMTTLVSTKKLIQMDVKRKKRKKVIDQLAAVEILQSYLDQIG